MSTNFQQSLSEHVARLTNNGESIVTFLHDAMNDDSGYFKQCHRLQAAGILAKHSKDEDALAYIRENQPNPRNNPRNIHKEESLTKIHLAQLVERATGDGLIIIQHLIDVMQGRNPAVEEGLTPFKPHHRMTAASELIKLGCCTSTLIPDGTGAHSAPTTDANETQPTRRGVPRGRPATHAEVQDLDGRTPEERENDAQVIAQHTQEIEQELANMTDEERNPPLKYEPNYSMWRQIGMGGVTPPPPGQDMTEPIQRMNEIIARQEKAFAAKMREKQRNDNDDYDDS